MDEEYGSQPLRWSLRNPMIVDSWYLYSCIISHTNKSGMACVTNKISRSNNMYFWSYFIKGITVSASWHCSLYSQALREASYHIMKTIKTSPLGSPCGEEPTCQYQPASHENELPCKWILQSQSRLKMSAAWDIWLQPRDPEPKPPYQASTQIPYLQKPLEIINNSALEQFVTWQ